MTIVKALEWDEPRCGPDEYKTIGKADALGFYYILERRYMSDKFTVTRSSDIQPFAWQDSPDDAKAAAQADYEARILSALTPTPDLASENERLRAALIEAWFQANLKDGMKVEQARIHAQTRMEIAMRADIARAALERT